MTVAPNLRIAAELGNLQEIRRLEKRSFGGFGVYMVGQLVDQVIHRVPPQGGNELTLVEQK